MKSILKLNEISSVADKVFKDYHYSKEEANPDGIMLRSFNMHDYAFGDHLLAIARAGAGVNNIPIDRCTENGIVVFNTPGANANAVKELVLLCLLMAARNILPATKWVQSLQGKEDIAKLVEKGKSAFVGPEIQGKKLGVIGLGAIGALVANAAENLGMDVIGYDPFISVEAAWRLSSSIHKADNLNDVLAQSDFITLHLPYNADTKNMINETTFAKMKSGAYLINCSRGELVNNAAVKEALASGKLSAYVTDFPNEEVIGNEKIYAIPHLGASTPEAEDNCALMAAKQLTDYLENGNIHNSVNMPSVSAPKTSAQRVTIFHQNIKNMLTQFTAIIAGCGVNISNMVSSSKKEIAYTMLDIDEHIGKETIDKIQEIEGVIRVRLI